MYSRIYNVCITLAFILVVLVYASQPTPVITVDVAGEPMGHYEWFGVSKRSQYEVLASAKRFVQHYTSLNANTIFEDAAIALNAMCDSLREETKLNWKTHGYLGRIENTGATSRVQFDDEHTQVLQMSDGRATLRLRGDLIVGLKEPEKSPFDIALEVELVPRSPENTLGLKVCSIS